MSRPTRDQILADLAAMLRTFNDREYSGAIGPRTLLFDDLGLVSIDAVVLGETIEQHYARKFPFHQFLAELGKKGARDIELGELATFLEQNMNERDGAGEG